MCHRLCSVIAVLLALTTTVTASNPPQAKPSDAEIKKLIVGKWAQEIEGGNGVKVKGTTTYKRDGTFVGEATIAVAGQSIHIALEGTWKVQDGVIAETVEKSNSPAVSKGQVSKDQVLSISQRSMERKDDQGKRTVQTRVGD
jgi:hypothetical protein